MRDRIAIPGGETPAAAIAGHEATRRDAMRRGIALGGTLLAATSIPLLLGVRSAFAQADGDASILEAALRLEQTAVVAYDTALSRGLLDAATSAVVRQLRDQEQEHADALRTELEALGGSAPAPPKPDEVGGLAGLKRQADVVRFAIELETAAVAAYYDAAQKLEASKLLQTVVSIMASEGQHLVVLRQALKRDPVPNAFETGEG